MKTDFEKKQKKFQAYRQKYDRQQLRTIKLIAEAVKLIISNNNKRFDNKDIKDLSLKVYSDYNKFNHIRIRNTLMRTDVQETINNELLKIYIEAGLSKDEIRPLLENVKSWILEKKDIANGLKLIDKLETVNNLAQKNSFTARTTETIDYSRLGKDGQPAQKVTKTLEISKNTSDIMPENEEKTRENTQADIENEPKRENINE